MVDATYRTELRDLNELNYARFDAKLEQRLTELGAEILTRVTDVTTELRSEMRAGFARTDQRMAEFETRLTKRLFGFWIAQAATTVGLVFGVAKLIS